MSRRTRVDIKDELKALQKINRELQAENLSLFNENQELQERIDELEAYIDDNMEEKNDWV